MESFQMPYGLSTSGEEKLHLTSSHLPPTEAWRSPDSTTSEGRRVSSGGTVRKLHTGRWAKFEERATHGWGKIVHHNCSDLPRLVRTLRTIQWPCTLVLQCHFLHFRTLLFFGLTSYPAEIAYFNSPNWELFNGVRVMALYWSKIVDPSRSPCLRTVQRKSFERGNFLVWRPVLLKNAYFNSANR